MGEILGKIVYSLDRIIEYSYHSNQNECYTLDKCRVTMGHSMSIYSIKYHISIKTSHNSFRLLSKAITS